MLQRIGAFTAGLAAVPLLAQESKPTAPVANSGSAFNVRDFGARGDGRTDDTAAIQRAIDAAAQLQGGVVALPPGNYLVASHLTVKAFVTLEGVWRAPKSGPVGSGSTLLAVADKGRGDGTPFITLERNATLAGVTIFYPEQTRPVPVPYPWTIRAAGDDVSLLNLLLVNPWQAVNLDGAGRHFIHGLYAHPLYRGLYIDAIFDVGRIDQVHFWPFWAPDDFALHSFTANNLESFVIGRTDWQYMSNCFTIFPKVGFRFLRTKAGPPNGVFTTCGSDVGPKAVVVDEAGPGSGISFVNGQFMSAIEIAETNRGPVKFTACGYWGLDKRGAARIGSEVTRSHAVIRGTGHVTFNSCNFHGWNRADTGDPCIRVESGGVTVTACEFAESWPTLSLAPAVEAAIIMGNRFCEDSPPIDNRMTPKYCQIGLNVSAPRSGRKVVPGAK